jgi:hypothetical protein
LLFHFVVFRYIAGNYAIMVLGVTRNMFPVSRPEILLSTLLTFLMFAAFRDKKITLSLMHWWTALATILFSMPANRYCKMDIFLKRFRRFSVQIFFSFIRFSI